MIRRTPRSTRTDTLFPYTTLVRSKKVDLTVLEAIGQQLDAVGDVIFGKERSAEHDLGRGQRQPYLVELGPPDFFEQVTDIGDDLIGRDHHLGLVEQRLGQRLQKFELPEIERCRHRPAPIALDRKSTRLNSS